MFAASVLWLQGSTQLSKQPINNADYSLVYNGDIFDDESKSIRGLHGDTKLFLDMFKSEDILQSLYQTNGPFAFVCLDKKNSLVYFGRDKYGRRSLLMGICGRKEIIFTSVAQKDTKYKFFEIPAMGIYIINLKTRKLVLRPWFLETHTFSTGIKKFWTGNFSIDDPICSNAMFKDFIFPTRNDLYFVVNLSNYAEESFFDAIFSSPKMMDNIMKLEGHLSRAVERRVSIQPNFCKDCLREEMPCDHPVVGILFSGGVDCAILALLADRFIEPHRPIDLINVAFSKKSSSANQYSTPDRLTGRKTLKELEMLCPQREWNFVEINVPIEELDAERTRRIADVIYPLNTILDDSLGCALWFASRGVAENYTSPCRVLLAGMGADELFGGYSHHRVVFHKEGWSGLHTSLKKDWHTLPYRNLGRDDRVVGDHGRQLRTPYLDEDVVQFLLSLDSWEKTFPSDEISQGIGPKYLLRAVAHHLGLVKTAQRKKKALQFGSKIANSKEKAHEVSPRL
ncbi:hypothetical protein HHI36_000322 [Cryptolaemus montrouzieri]